ncbi:MAG: Gfo/Idh/MocA family oxidoreductase [Spirochaetes bacterium]|nr:Gfo/Idh/MocA family oxidoreductase [Spirochaetota bacterium]
MKINAALIGCGRIGFLLENDPLRNKPCTHFGGALSAGIKFNYACDSNSNRLNAFSAKANLKSKFIYSDYIDLLKETDLDLAVISADTPEHYKIIKACAKKKVRVIVSEKPLTAEIKTAREIIDICEKNSVILITNHERRYDPYYRKAKQLIDSGKLGNLISIRGSMMTSSHRGNSLSENGGGPFLHDGTHLVDMIRFFSGDIACVNSEFKRYSRQKGFEDYIAAHMKSENGVQIFAEAGGGCSYFAFELDIVLSKGRIIIGNGYRKLYTPKESSFYTGFYDLSEDIFPTPKDKHNSFTNLYREVKSLISGKISTPTSSGLDGYKALEIINAAYLSSHKRKPVYLPLSPETVNIKRIFNI